MKEKISLFFYRTAESITLYWEKPEAEKGPYVIRSSDGTELVTTKTHARLLGLQPETEYEIELTYGNQTEKIRVKTDRKKEDLLVTDPAFGAVGDGKQKNTRAIQKAVDACGKNQRLVFPAGTYLTGAICLHSDMELYFEKGAVLKGTACPEDYEPKIWSRFEGTELECYSSLLNLGTLDHKSGYNCKNVVISGEGTIESGGRILAERVMEKERERLKEYLDSLGDQIKEYENADTIPGRVRPRLINMSNAQNVRITGMTLKNGASWNVHMIYSDQIVTDHCAFYSENVWNGDGWDPDSSTNCTIFACSFHTGDDAIAIKSGKNPEGNKINRPSWNIRIFDCTSSRGHGITIGSEMSGGVEQVTIWDCDMSQSVYGIEIKGTKKRGGYVRNVTVKDTKTSRVLARSVPYNDDGISAGTEPFFSDFYFENVEIMGAHHDREGNLVHCNAVELTGFETAGHEISNVVFYGGKIHGTICMKNCRNVQFTDAKEKERQDV